jgi:hypothetical protein
MSFVHAAIRVDKTTFAVCHVLVPVPLEEGSASPVLGAFALPEALLGPLAHVDRAIVEFEGASGYQILRIVGHLSRLVPLERPIFFFSIMRRLGSIVRNRLAKSCSTRRLIQRALLTFYLHDIVL